MFRCIFTSSSEILFLCSVKLQKPIKLIILECIKAKDKFHPKTSHEGPQGEQKGNTSLSLTSALDVFLWFWLESLFSVWVIFLAFFNLLLFFLLLCCNFRRVGLLSFFFFWSTPRPGRSNPGKESRYQLYKRLGGSEGRSGWVLKISSPPAFDPPTFQPVASRHTDYATQVQC